MIGTVLLLLPVYGFYAYNMPFISLAAESFKNICVVYVEQIQLLVHCFPGA